MIFQSSIPSTQGFSSPRLHVFFIQFSEFSGIVYLVLASLEVPGIGEVVRGKGAVKWQSVQNQLKTKCRPILDRLDDLNDCYNEIDG